MKRTLKPRYRFDQNAHHYQLLGLKRGECRIEVIRQAARRRATNIAGRSHPATVDLHRAEIAIAVYRLLDPRGRSQLYERVQLSCPFDMLESTSANVPPHSPINRSLNLVRPECEVSSSQAHGSQAVVQQSNSPNVRIMEGEIVEQAIEQAKESCSGEAEQEEEESAPRSESFHLTDGGSKSGELTMDERRQFVELLKSVSPNEVVSSKHNVESISRSTARTTVGWIRSYLGI